MRAAGSGAPISGVRLLLEGDVSEAARIAAELDRLNSERRIIEQAAEAQAEAEAMASLGLEDKGAVIVTAAEGWHPGIVGLVASRLKEKFARPAFAIALEPGGIGTGSGRSISGVDLGKAVRQAVKEKLLMKGGGHAMAAGVTLRKEKLAEFRAFMESALAEDVANSRHEHELFIDGAVSARSVTVEFATMLNRAGPFGAGNPEPVIALPAHQLVYADEVGQAHLRLRFKSGDGAIVNGIAFRSVGQKLGHALTQNRGQPLHVAGSLAVDRFQGSERVQLRVTRRRGAGSGAGRDKVIRQPRTTNGRRNDRAGSGQGRAGDGRRVRHWRSGFRIAGARRRLRRGHRCRRFERPRGRGADQEGGRRGESFWHHDVTSEERWIEVVAEVMKRYGRLDVLVSNAGIGIAVPSITEMSLADWRRQTAINLDGVFLSVKHCLPAMRKTGGGSVIMMSSLAGLRGAASLSGYCATKGGVRLFAKAIAMECATFGDGIRVNSVHPGIIDTPIWGKIPTEAAGAGQNAPIDPEERAKMATPLGRAGQAEEIAQGVLYLASDASRYVTGTELVIDGGMNAGGVVRRA